MRSPISNQISHGLCLPQLPRCFPSPHTKSFVRFVPSSNRPGVLLSKENEDEPVTEVLETEQNPRNLQLDYGENTEELGANEDQNYQLLGINLKDLAGPALGAFVLISVVAFTAVYKEDISKFLEAFIKSVEDMGPAGGFAYAGLYIILETLAVPATPLTLTAGYLFGQIEGTLIVSLSATTAALIAFLISRYAARGKITEMASNNKQFAAIDKAIEKDGFKFVFLLRLSPLLPFAASNYLYGLTSIEARSYMLASWLGMLPGTYAYVSAGSVSREILSGGTASFSPWEIGLALSVTFACLWYAGNVAKKALDEVTDES